MKNQILLLASVLTLLGACGGDDADDAPIVDAAPADADVPFPLVETCEATSAAYCSKVYACLTEEERGDEFPPTEAECVTELNEDVDCANITLENACRDNDGATVLHPEFVLDCLAESEAVTCEQFVDENMLEAATPSCAMVCQPT
jgi:hypothetical protein